MADTKRTARPRLKLSEASWLRLIAGIYGTIFIGFGINCMLRPVSALSFFEWEMPSLPSSRHLIEQIMIIYGIRDVFMGVALYATAYYRATKACGWMLLACSAVAFTDGYVCWMQGKGQWTHWNYAPFLTVFGCLMLGCVDRV